ncbi:hypothetical protein NECAME_13508 [Necator americanus]|uniref:Uncharacterized protein n=1 Tax=Necator americanus TaxID=51031 RepID=W2SV44_NECAM|nr:hypothetical protein NECAME_13508 [Necator americanus]ETN73505.1 hypothetical protein NECAME_13508 [Necator americanus]
MIGPFPFTGFVRLILLPDVTLQSTPEFKPIKSRVGLLVILTSCVVAHPQFGGLPGGPQPGLL